MKHIFLTGVPGIGKSTIINRVLEETGLSAKGFRTVKESADERGSSFIYLYSYGSGSPNGRSVVACRYEETGGFAVCTGAFDEAGVAALENTANAELILMDELGFMESEACRFQEKVMEILNGDISVLGVVKERDTPFLSGIRSHPEVVVFEITIENRDSFAAILQDMLLSIIEVR
jgi:nucleoside-triphosphatase